MALSRDSLEFSLIRSPTKILTYIPIAYFILRSERNRLKTIALTSSSGTLKAGGTLINLPSGPFTVAGGLEYRSESLIQSNDKNSEFNNIASGDFEGHLLSARRYVRSAYGELDVPLLGEKWSWPGLKNLDVIFSERYDDYSDFGSAEKPKIAIRYKPFDDLTFRGTYAEGFVAPTLGELFATPMQGEQQITDPQ